MGTEIAKKCRCDVQNLIDGLCKTFRKFRELRRMQLVHTLNHVRCCDCGHRIRLKKSLELQGKSDIRRAPSPSRVRTLLWICITLLLLLYAYLIHVVRRYNHVRTYGSGACESTFLLKYNDCDVQY
ncbi:hypothetical protein KR018_006966 [Drosophila ironensis]|nr:hypothetical protein KR018_006966 [Drosophila ironensis]